MPHGIRGILMSNVRPYRSAWDSCPAAARDPNASQCWSKCHSSTGSPPPSPTPELCAPPEGCTLTPQLLLAPAQSPGGHACANLKRSSSGDTSALPHCQDGRAHSMRALLQRGHRPEACGEGKHNWKVEAIFSRILLSLHG